MPNFILDDPKDAEIINVRLETDAKASELISVNLFKYEIVSHWNDLSDLSNK